LTRANLSNLIITAKIISNEVWKTNIFEKKDDVMKALYLSYEDLPYQLKQCFVYCSLFPEDYTFHKKRLVQLWIAEGFLGDKISLESGEDFLEELVSRNILQRDIFYGDYLKLHDLLRSLGQFLGNGEHLCGNLENLDRFVRHFYHRYENSLVSDDLQRLHEKLRTFMLFGSSEIKEVPRSVFKKLQYLRVLCLSNTRIIVVPDSIKYLLHIRYLDLSYNYKITTIPESIGHLKNLQFLLLNYCWSLKKLPSNITNLQNLMSLEYYSFNVVQMPKGIERLKQLELLRFLELKFFQLTSSLVNIFPLHEFCDFNDLH
jgi:hypothetical protein